MKNNFLSGSKGPKPGPKLFIQEPGAQLIRIWTNDVEDEALTQLKHLARLPFIASNGLAVMPDVHAGKGSTIGTVIATDKAIIPAAVGVDIGCGMCAVRTTLRASDLPDSLRDLRHQIERDIPTGDKRYHRDADMETNIERLQATLIDGQRVSGRLYGTMEELGVRNGWEQYAASQLGTLGGGNHFIEICLDEDQNVWIMLHSGSRGIGNKLGMMFIEKAKRKMEQYFINLPDKDLAYLPDGTPEFDQYCEAVEWGQRYAFENRKVMLEKVLAAMRRHIDKPFEIVDEAINCHHNYIERENHFGKNLWVTRKGAIRARENDLGIIPGSMGAKSFIVRGKGNPGSYCSCSHGAGRRMSRTDAKAMFTAQDLAAQTQGIECHKGIEIVDESPKAYKDIDEVMANQSDLVEVVHTLRQVVCVKGK